MKLKTIAYSESRETVDARGLKQWIKYGVEVEPDALDNWESVEMAARKMVKNWHEQHNPSNYFNNTEPEQLPIEDRGLIEKMEIAIDNATTLSELNVLANDLPTKLQPMFIKKQRELLLKDYKIHP